MTMKFTKKLIPLYYLIILLIVNIGTVALFYLFPKRVVEKIPETNTLPLAVFREHQYKLTKPFLLMDLHGEDESFSSLKTTIQNIINEETASGKVKTVSVYVKKFGGGRWFSVN